MAALLVWFCKVKERHESFLLAVPVHSGVSCEEEANTEVSALSSIKKECFGISSF